MEHLVDVLNEDSLQRAGRLLWEADRQPFVAGSSGVAYALLAHWGLEARPSSEAPPVDRLLVLSGSCSPATERQIAYAGAHGYTLVRVDPINGSTDERCIAAALDGLTKGSRGVVIYTAGSAKDRVESFGPTERKTLGERSGRDLDRVLAGSGGAARGCRGRRYVEPCG